MAIILIGFMGVGKTTIGQELSRYYNKQFIDLDYYIEEKVGIPIPKIFEQYGENYFRKLETEALKRWINEDVILSTGGGIIESKESRDLLKKTNLTIWLKCDIEILHKRIKNDANRPNAKGKNLHELKGLYSRRKLRYNETAYTHIDAYATVDIVVKEIIEKLQHLELN